MLEFTVEHKYSKTIHVVEGENVFQAYKNNNLDFNLWTVIDTEKIF